MPLTTNLHTLPVYSEFGTGGESVSFALGVACMVLGINKMETDAELESAYRRIRLYERAFNPIVTQVVDDEVVSLYLADDPDFFRKFQGFRTNCAPMTDAQCWAHLRKVWTREVHL